ncbi:DNA replication/repair protein RecF [Prosthecomicrobium sp. N25]|uniref:DNA replication/repair protein RecF n=1 Tax=Prosthecomicrobium sp. N25 TaxID=3129254 RepID=UPI003076C35A
MTALPVRRGAAGTGPEAEPRPARVALTGLRLTDFRNYATLALDLDGRHVVLAGENGAGKTNLMEAVSLLSPGRGFRRATQAEMARAGGPGGFAVAATLEGPDGEVRIGTGVTEPDEDGAARKVRIDGEPARSAEAMLDHVRVLWLTPASDGLFTGPASDRRRFLDRLVLALDPGHGSRVSAFERAMRGRNRLLEEEAWDVAWIGAVEAQMAELGAAIAAARVETVSCLAGLVAATREETAAFPHAELALEGELEALAAAGGPAGVVEDRYREILAAGRARDRASGRTLDGPHRADLRVQHGPKAMPAELSSTGEQKALLIGLVLAHARLVGATLGRAPVILLDEIAAHLDQRRRAALFEVLDRLGGQCWMTGTDLSVFAPLGERAEAFEVEAGRLHRAPLG